MHASARFTFAAALAAVVGCAGAASAQLAPTPQPQRPIITTGKLVEDAKAKLRVNDLAIVSLDVAPAFGVPLAFEMPIEGQWMNVRLQPHDVRSEGFRLLAQIADGSLVEVEPGPVNTFQGDIAEIPGSRVGMGFVETGLQGVVVMPDGSTYWLEPLAEAVQNAVPGQYIVYRGTDVVPSEGSCGTTALPAGDEPGGPETGDCGGFCVAQLACDADVEYYISRGSSVINVQNRITSITNANNTLYLNQVLIQHSLPAIIVRTAEPDPYTSTNPSTLLNQFRTEWLNNQGSITRDVAELFTAKNLDGSTIGIAFTIGGICTTSAYCLVQSDCCGSFACATDLSAHELGHLWGASHCSAQSNSTMNSGLMCVNNFNNCSPSSITSITNHRNSRTCLTPGTPQPPPGPFNLVSPPDGATGVSTGPLLDWDASLNAVSYQLTADDDPAFGSPYFNFNALTATQLQCQPNTFPDQTTVYWRVIASNGNGGFTTGTPAVSSFFVGTPPPLCPEDLDGDGDVDSTDLNLLLTEFGCTSNCGADIDGDGDVDSTDLNLLLVAFGETC